MEPLGLKAAQLDEKNFTIITAKRTALHLKAPPIDYITPASAIIRNNDNLHIDSSVRTFVPDQKLTDTVLPDKIIRGRVISVNGESPVPGATILVHNMNIGTTTDAEGYFTIRIPGRINSITVGHISFTPINLTPTDKTLMTIRLTPRKEQLEQVIVSTGMYKRPKENFTGAATTVSGEDLRRVNNVNVLDALKVFDPSVRIPDNVQFGSDPNRLPTITLRGTNNFPQQTTGNATPSSGADFMANYASNPNQPSFILDGFEVSLQKIYDLDINRIASFTILKDAAATSMYGSKAANGVTNNTYSKLFTGFNKINEITFKCLR